MTDSGKAPRRKPRSSTHKEDKPSTGIQRTLESSNQWLSHAGLSIPGLGFFLHWWKKLGALGALAVSLAVVMPAGGYAVLAYSTSHSIPGWIGDFGVQFEAADWSVHVLSLSSVARDVKLRRDSHSEPVFTAAEIDFHGTPWTVFSSLFGRGGAYHEMTIKHGQIVVERSLTGDFNWADFLHGVPEDRRRDAMDGLYTIDAIHLEDVRVVYLEHMPGGSGEGVIRTSDARVIFDEVNGRLMNVKRPGRSGDRPTELNVRARLADGIVEIKGDLGLFPERFIATAPRAMNASLSDRSGAAKDAQLVSAADDPSYELRLYLENISMGAYGQMVTTTQIVPNRGRLGGNVTLREEQSRFSCECNLRMEDVGFQPNERLVGRGTEYDQLNRSLASYRKTGTFDVCGSGVSATRDAGPTDHSVSAMTASFNAQATDTAPANVRAIALRDQHTMAGVVAGAVADEFLKDQPSDAAVTKDLKSVGRGLKRLFGK